MTSLRFLFDGKRINDDETPKQVNFYLNLKFWMRHKISFYNFIKLFLKIKKFYQ